jgi:hypothetical protein
VLMLVLASMRSSLNGAELSGQAVGCGLGEEPSVSSDQHTETPHALGGWELLCNWLSACLESK